ncbi:MAG TPA: PHP domain-containing protein, partial [Dehalococcoidia bacterium]|nr:PHP domain-containing protein [Dehalococcoidia bacterium]
SGLGEETLLRLLDRIDVIESFNARCLAPGDNTSARRFAAEHGIPAIAVSDAHSPGELGQSYVELPDFDGPTRFLESLKQARLVKKHSSPLVHLASRWAVTRRKLLHWSPTD